MATHDPPPPTPAPDPADRLADAMLDFLRGGPVPDPPTSDAPAAE